jgi:SAM-dependent methyltransferase
MAAADRHIHRHRENHQRFWDLYAPTYDRCTIPPESHERRVNLEILRRTFFPGQRLLEIGGGTGTEAKAMMDHGCVVLFTDNSLGMLAAARAKLGRRAWIVQLPAEEVGSLGTAFDGAYASFGVLNCLVDLASFFGGLYRVLKPGARFVASFGNRWYLGDVLLFLLRRNNFLRLRWKASFPMWLNGDFHRARAGPLSYRRVVRAASPHFRSLGCVGLPVFLPPHYAGFDGGIAATLSRALLPVERALASRFPFRLLGDQTAIVLERRDFG